MAGKPGGRPSDWTSGDGGGGRIRTPLGHKLVLAVFDWLNGSGLNQSDSGAVARALAVVRIAEPFNKYEKLSLKSFCNRFYEALNAALPPVEPRDYLISELQKFGMPPDTSVALAGRLIEVCAVKMPLLGLDYVVRMIGHAKRARRLRTGESKIRWFQRATEMLDNPKPRFPIRPWDEASNANIEATKSALHDGLTAIDEIAARTGIKHRTQQELLCFLEDIGEARRLKHGHYGPPQEGAPDYVRTGEIVWNMLETPASPEEARLRAAAAGHHLTEEQVTGALHWLWRKAKKIRRPAPNLYARPGPGVTDHVFAHDAMLEALVLGTKSMSEIETITGKNRKELSAGFRRHLRPDGLAEQVGFLSGGDVRPGFRGRIALYALTAKGRRELRTRTD